MNFIVAKIPAIGAGRAARRGDELPSSTVRMFENKDIPKVYYTREEDAVNAARDLASTNPTIQYGVFAATRIFETTAPNILEKGYNADGELVIQH